MLLGTLQPTKNSEADACAGSGIYVGPDHALNRSIQIPKSIEQSNPTGEIVATLTATMTAGSKPDYCRKQIHAL